MSEQVSIKEFTLSLVKAIDSYNCLLKGHHRRCAYYAYQIGKEYGLDKKTLSNLVLASAIHDIGALHVVEVEKLLEVDVTDTLDHEIMGSRMLMGFKPFEPIRKIIRYHHIHYDEVIGGKYEVSEIPIECYFLHLADRIDILSLQNVDDVKSYIEKEINSRFSETFHPMLQNSFNNLAHKSEFYNVVEGEYYYDFLSENITNHIFTTSNEDIEEIAKIFGHIVDFKSEWTEKHSETVSKLSDFIAWKMSFDDDSRFKLRIAGYLHDIGKIAVPKELLDKKAKLSDIEFHQIQDHALYSSIILSELKGIENIAKWASSHHEKRDGTGYPLHTNSDHFTIEMDIIAFSDIFSALSENRPYRSRMSKTDILSTLSQFVPERLNEQVFKVIKQNIDDLYQIAVY